MPLPYPEHFEKKNDGDSPTPFPVRATQKMLNLMVAALNWLRLGQPAVAPRPLGRGRKLIPVQWTIVRRLERLVSEVQYAQVVTPQHMGRNATKVENLDSLLQQMFEVASSSQANSYENVKERSRPGSHVAKVGHEHGSHPEVIGKHSNSEMVQAKRVDASRLTFPQEKPAFDPLQLFGEPHATVYRDPISCALQPGNETEPPPRVRAHGSETDAMQLFRFLDGHGRLRVVPEEKVRLGYLCGAFSLTKDSSKDRLVLDARADNLLESTHRLWVQTLGAVSTLLQTELRPDNNLSLSGTDLQDYYYCFKVSREECTEHLSIRIVEDTSHDFFLFSVRSLGIG